jgi:hypothetical protein
VRICFLRFGDLPPEGRSLNHLTDELEGGVSVFTAIEQNGTYYIPVPTSENACVDLSSLIRRPWYEVDGEPTGTGSIGETLLANCKIVKKIQGDTDWRT